MRYDRGDSFLSFLNQMEFHLVQNRKENCPHDHIPFNMEGNENIVFSVYIPAYKEKRPQNTAVHLDKMFPPILFPHRRKKKGFAGWKNYKNFFSSLQKTVQLSERLASLGNHVLPN